MRRCRSRIGWRRRSLSRNLSSHGSISSLVHPISRTVRPAAGQRAAPHQRGGSGGIDGDEEDIVAHQLYDAHHHRGALEECAQRGLALEQLPGDSVALGHLAVQLLIAPAQLSGALADAGLELLLGLLKQYLGLLARRDIRHAADVAGQLVVLELRGDLRQHPRYHAHPAAQSGNRDRGPRRARPSPRAPARGPWDAPRPASPRRRRSRRRCPPWRTISH